MATFRDARAAHSRKQGLDQSANARDGRMEKARGRQDHYFEQKINESEEPKTVDDPRTVGSDKTKEPSDI